MFSFYLKYLSLLGLMVIWECGANLQPSWADVESGPEIGVEVAGLPVWGVTGEVTEQTVDYAKRRGELPTVYVFISQSHWGRPAARFLRELDKDLRATAENSSVIVVWLTDDVAGAKEYLPKVQLSLKLFDTALTVFEGPAAGPDGWAVHDQADLTAVVANKGKVAARFGFVSVNETVVSEVLKELKQATEE